MTEVIHPLDAIFKPQSIAFIGATMREGSLGRTLIKNLMKFEYTGKLFPVNPNKDVIHSIKCYSTVLDIPDPVDLGIIFVPREQALTAAEQCGKKGVKGLLVLTAGFREVGGTGIEAEKKLVEITRQYGMRLIGPNCMGIVNTDPSVRMNATISTVSPKPGNVAFLTQSGGLGIIIFSQTHRYNVGLSMFASIGNKADVLDNDMIEYWGNDERTDVILLYMEGVDNPRQFAQAVRRVSKKKPILAVKAGRTTVGARAASSHTGAMAEEDSIITGLFEQCGIIRVDSIEELFELAVSFSRKRFPKSKKVAVISNGGGPAVMAVDACIGLGLDVSPFSETTRKKIADSLFDISATVNPVDMSGMAGTAEFEKVLQCAIEDSEIGSALVILVKSPVLIDPMDVLNKIENASQTTDKPILTMVIGQDVMRRNNESDSIPDIPVYECIESAVWTLFNMTRYKEWLEKQDGHIKTYDVDKNSVNALLAPESNKPQHYLEPGHVFEILSAYRFPVIPSFDAGTLHQAITIAEQIGYPIVLKGIAKGLIHKSDIGGVALDLRTREEVIKAFAEIKERVNAVNYDSFEGVIVQKMITSGREVILGMTAIEHLGPVLMFGLGGIFVEAIRDVCFRPAPITDVEADEIIRSIKGYPILKGIRGEKGVDIECIKECLLRLSQLVCDFDCIQSIDINPFKVGESARTSFVVDARIVVGKK